MALTTGIDDLGGSLLSQSATKRQQLRDDYKKQQKRERQALLLTGALKLFDNAVRERHNNWYNSEANLTASRLLKRNQKMMSQREAYETALAASNMSPLDYELQLVSEQLPLETLKSKVPALADYSDQAVSDILHGSGDDPGLYRDLANSRLAARNEWAENIQDLDPEAALAQWKASNPYSKNLLGGAFNYLKRSICARSSTG